MSTNMSTTLNGTNRLMQPWGCFNPTAERIGKTFAYCLLFVASMVGNTFIGIIVYKTKVLRKPNNFFIVNMAMSDLLTPIFLFPRIVKRLYVDSWLISGPLGQALCKLVPFVPYASVAVSIQSLVLIAVDRFGAVVFPLRSPLIGSKLCPFFILATWIIAMAISSPYLYVAKVFEIPGGQLQACLWPPSETFRLYVVSVTIFLFCAPFILITILYIIIYSKLKAQRIPGDQSINIENQRMKRERNVLNMGLTIVLAFSLCWLPFIISRLLLHSETAIALSCGFRYFDATASFLARANCAINPYICFIFSGNYRQGLKNVVRCFQPSELRANQVAP